MKRITLVSVAILVLVAVFTFQRFNYAVALTSFLPEPFRITGSHAIFIFNKTIRLVLNDLACMVLIFAWFRERKYLVVACCLFLIELFIIFPVYLAIKLTLEGDSEISSPLLSQVHRLIVNPLLMFLLMAGFVYQRIRDKKA